MAQDAQSRPRRLLCVGNPLLELHAEVPRALLDRHGLPPNVAVQAEDQHRHLLGELRQEQERYKLSYALGGGAVCAGLATQGLLRSHSRQSVDALGVASKDAGGAHSASHPPAVAFLGGIGCDEMGGKLRDLLKEEGVLPLLSESDNEATGWRLVLRQEGSAEATGQDGTTRCLSLVSTATCTGAARDYKLDHLRFKVWESVEAAYVVYVESFFLTVSAECAKILAEHCAKMGNVFCLNLSAPYLCRFFADRVLALLPYTDHLLGSEAEFLALREHRKDTDSTIDDVVTWLGKMPRADGDVKKRRYIVVTNGDRPVIVASTWQGYGVKVQRYPVPPLRDGRCGYKDGAGDAFAGGFLYGLLHELDPDSCVQLALHAAHCAVQRLSPGNPVFKDHPRIPGIP